MVAGANVRLECPNMFMILRLRTGVCRYTPIYSTSEGLVKARDITSIHIKINENSRSVRVVYLRNAPENAPSRVLENFLNFPIQKLMWSWSKKEMI